MVVTSHGACFRELLEGTARYAGLLLAPAEGFGRARGFFCPSGKKRAFDAIGHFWCLVVTSVTFSSNLINFEKKSKETKKNPKISKNPNKNENPK